MKKLKKLKKNDTWGESGGEDHTLPKILKSGRRPQNKLITNHHLEITVEQIAFNPDTYIVVTADEAEYTVTEGADGELEVTSKFSEEKPRGKKKTTRIAINAVMQFRNLR